MMADAQTEKPKAPTKKPKADLKAAPKSMSAIGGAEQDMAVLAKPASGRAFRDAWQMSGEVIEIDMQEARHIRAVQLTVGSALATAEAEREATMALLSGDAAAHKVAKDKANKFRGDPKPAGVKALADATTPEQLLAVTLDTLF